MAPSSSAAWVLAGMLCAMGGCTGAWGRRVALAFFDAHALLGVGADAVMPPGAMG